jgi:hypothetical protein
MLSEFILTVAILLLHEVLIEYFELTKQEFKGENLHFYFTENNSDPVEFKNQ